MDFAKLAPWNWFKKEEEHGLNSIPLSKKDSSFGLPASFHDMEKDFNHLIELLKHRIGGGLSSESFFKDDWFKPSLDVASDDKEYSVKIELPGIEAENISIEYSSNTLKIRGEKRLEKEEKDKNFYRVERSYGSFQRILDLPEDSDIDNIKSSYKDGVLSIKIPKKTLPDKDTKKIEIKSD